MRNLSYEIPIRNPLGPKSTRANIVERIVHKDLKSFTTIMSTVNTPDVPQGSNFHSITRVCMMRCAQPNRTRLRVTCKVEWQKSTWLKGPIEKGVLEGNQGFYRALAEDVKRYLKAPQPSVDHKSNMAQEGHPRRRRGSRAHNAVGTTPGDRHRHLADADASMDTSKSFINNNNDDDAHKSESSLISSIIDGVFGWFTPVRLLGLAVLTLCLAINVWCWYQLTGPAAAPVPRTAYRGSSSGWTADGANHANYADMANKARAYSMMGDTANTGEAMDRLLSFLAELRRTHEESPDSSLYLAEMDHLRQRLIASYTRFRQLDLRVIELTRKIVDIDRELRNLMHTVEAERALLINEMDHIVSVYDMPPDSDTSSPSTDDTSNASPPVNDEQANTESNKMSPSSASSSENDGTASPAIATETTQT
ncbi:hypothetical protein BDF22DRAFT_304608 [Syncephalis plumigaleata]|nr:hypothetical protein BDF22DRAFT_304608 [Syncephalis plumigaleata]